MKITAISVDETSDDPREHKFYVKLASGETFHGVRAMNEIMIRKNPNDENQLEPYLDGWARQYLRRLKREALQRKRSK